MSYYIVALKLQLQASRNDKYTAYIQLLCALPYAECPNDLARPFDEYKYSCILGSLGQSYMYSSMLADIDDFVQKSVMNHYFALFMCEADNIVT